MIENTDWTRTINGHTYTFHFNHEHASKVLEAKRWVLIMNYFNNLWRNSNV